MKLIEIAVGMALVGIGMALLVDAGVLNIEQVLSNGATLQIGTLS